MVIAPFPGRRNTRAAAVLRRPVPYFWSAGVLSVAMGTSDRERLGLLRGVRMFGAGVDLELAKLRVAQWAFGQHALDRLFDHALGMLGQHLAQRGGLDAAGILGMAPVELVVELVAGDAHLGGVDH